MSDQNVYLRCSGCHTCSRCQKEKHIKAFRDNGRSCIECEKQASNWTCDACHIEKKPASFDKHILDNAQKHGRLRVCVTCQENGISPMDINTYTCSGCGQRGHNKFNKKALNNHKNPARSTPIVCFDCSERHDRIQKAIRSEGSLRCTCPGKVKDRVHLPGNEKCDLYPKHMGEKRWPGQNAGVTEDDLRFIDRLSKRRRL